MVTYGDSPTRSKEDRPLQTKESPVKNPLPMHEEEEYGKDEHDKGEDFPEK